MDRVWSGIRGNLNFFRIHLLFFTVTPIIFAAVFFAGNGEFHIPFIDALFCSVSAITVTGLTTVDLSSLTAWQQTLLMLQSSLGCTVTVSWAMVYFRRIFFKKKFRHVIEAELSRRSNGSDVESVNTYTTSRFLTRSSFRRKQSGALAEKGKSGEKGSKHQGPGVTTDMIRRADDALKPINPSGRVSEGHVVVPEPVHAKDYGRTSEDRPEVQDNRPKMSRSQTQTVEFSTPPAPEHNYSTIGSRRRRGRTGLDLRRWSYDQTDFEIDDEPSLHRTDTVDTAHGTMYTNYGGFPYPQVLLLRLFRRFFPKLQRRLVRTVTLPRTTTLIAQGVTTADVKAVPYISFDAIVGRNSKFYMLTEDNLEELGGVEYRGLTALLWIVGGYYIGIQLLSFAVIAPYMSESRWRRNFEPPQLHRFVSPPWYAFFQVVGAFTNAGLSLVDQSVIPFQRAYPLLVFMVICTLAGNTAFPIFLRCIIWTIMKLVPLGSRSKETLQFLLDHPRRCFVYLFPSHQTWFLVTILLALTLSDWLFFIVLDIGETVLEQIPTGLRVLIGLLQATAVRASGYSTVSIAALSPAVKVMYIIMMYISVYPIAMSVRSTNVYEERSLGVFAGRERKPEHEKDFGGGRRVAVWSRYLGWHVRQQLAFDIWWLGLALFLICIIERDKIENEDNFSWFTIFSIMFELISAYGTVGLSLGIPTANFSLSGAFRPLSKLIMCAVMLRGRHRGLPAAIDKAVMLPLDFDKEEEENDESEDEGDDARSGLRGASGGSLRGAEGVGIGASVENGRTDEQKQLLGCEGEKSAAAGT